MFVALEFCFSATGRRRLGRQNQRNQAHQAQTVVSGGDVRHPPAPVSAPSPVGGAAASTSPGPASTEALGETTGMYLKDSEGTMKTSEVTATFTNGKPRFVKGVVVMKGTDEWDRFMRFMERYAQANGLGFTKA